MQCIFKKYDLSADIVNDQYENTSRHFAIAKGQSLMAYGRITNLGKGIYQLSQIRRLLSVRKNEEKVMVKRCYKP